MVNNILYYRRSLTSEKWLVCIPQQHVNALINVYHQHFGHIGPQKCITAIRENCFFPSLYRKIRKMIRCCDLCQRSKFQTIRVEGPMQHILATEPRQKLCVDLIGPLSTACDGTNYIFVVLDSFTLFVRLYPIKKATAMIVTNRMVDQYIKTYGKPITIVSDHGVQFMSRVWNSRLSDLRINITTTSVYHP